MNQYELQLRAGIAALMAPADSLAARQGQINSMNALLNVGVVSMLLGIIDETRREAVNVLSFVVEQTSTDNPAWSRAVQHADHLYKLLQESGMTCEDEGCPHYGTAHSHVEHPTPTATVPQAPLEPIPSGVYYRPQAPGIASGFFQRGTDKAMGFDFAARWINRRAEFPEGRP